MFHHFKKIYLKLLPYHCVFCGQASQREQDLCQPCYKELPILTDFCPKCALPSENNQLCETCQNHLLPYDALYALFRYERPITRLILTLKFNRALNYGRLLGELMAEKIKEDWYKGKKLPDLIIPLPLHTQRLKKRGFNQALEITKPISKALNIQINITACKRTKSTKAQATLSLEERLRNVQNAFAVNADLTNKHIAIVDDVATTGSTIREFSSQLKLAGASCIDVWCCARAML
jgi:ComF family protein